jgi:hypothetical protein
MGRQKNMPFVQDPHPSPIHYSDLIFTRGTRRGSTASTFVVVMTAYIFWERVNDFVEGQVMEDGTQVLWASEDTIQGSPNLKHPQISPSIT